ncbi:transcriptional regulator with GAF, ATPase, and Fis domain [Flavobacterium nitrogenifigens]|uniref:Transcriptional regulator with GAF, ATPase, and Fis domain n=2 Tax=Flavobacterium TaxID=237 RepID=A0A7W7N973_9FLAO|nr:MULTISPECIES: sigma-54 dependent transcriptional regulator [Flavobacterium]MBB4804588.1 transcriptional regulator with GAF, ATPase, and Fis domain [Flavobacterium nitrogenifigens]MBB6389547.1 transcriptional regulator with GAF, ATPase, and Fis domain [Flavobacterium notoginsengisoli]
MEESTDKTAILMKRLQEREQEQMLILSICTALSSILNKEDFNDVVNGLLKDNFQFDDFILTSSNKDETEYQIFYQLSNKNIDSKNYLLNDGFFNLCLDSADTVIFDLIQDQKNPDYIQNNLKKGFKNGIGICLPNLKGNRNVLFLFFKNAKTFTRESNRILRGIAMQLSITVRNIILAQEYENNIAELKILKNISSENNQHLVEFEKEGFQGIVGNSDAMQEVYELISQVASSNSTVLIFGETGTGKELVANAIHHLSQVSKNRMVKVNCASIPENLIESELFGHEKGAFTGATEQRIGKFEQAENSTIFLDEIGELPLELQGKLLRVLQEKEIERVGGNKSIKINVRVIAATNKSLQREVAEERFRSDLYYRLNVYPIPLPALRERKGDIEVLGNFFLEKHSERIGKKIKGFSKKILNSMTANAWPGNVRELENMVERSILFAKEDVIKEMTFPEIFLSESETSKTEFQTKTLQEVEKEHILKVIKKCNGRISGPQGAAVLLGLPSTTLASRMQKLGIKKEHFLD